MLILTLRTDKPEAEIGLYEDDKQLHYEVWTAHRQLAETLHLKIAKNLQFVDKEIKDIQGVVVYEGPGSFTGLRIGISVANALAYSLASPVVATGDDWIETGIAKLLNGQSDKVALPEYGGEANITLPSKA